MKINRYSRERKLKRRLLTVIGILAMLLSPLLGSVFAQAPEPVPNVFLPIIFASGQPGPPPASPYAAALSQALADCADTTLNQVCYAGGSVTLDGGGPLATPGQVATLDGVSGLTLVSPNAGHWSIALLRLATDSPTPDLGLTILAFGNVEIRNLTLFDTAAGNGDVAPALSFSSSPVPNEDPETGGIIVYNPKHEEPLSISLNGADLTLASSAVVQAQPGVKMTVTMATGSALVTTAAGDSAAIQAQQLSVPLDNSGTATGAPTPPDLTDDELLEPLVPSDESDEDDLLEPLVPELPVDLNKELQELLADFDSAQYRCMQGNSRQVYRVMYYARLLKINKHHYPDSDALMDLIDVQVMRCATFEIEFNSDVTVMSSFASGSMYVQGQGMIVSYDMDGRLIQPAQMPLTHRRYDMNFPTGFSVVLSDGRLVLSVDGYIRINRNRLDISTKMQPVDVWEHLIACCPTPHEVANGYSWFTAFTFLHRSEQTVDGYRFTPAHWKYTGNQILAEAIFSREVPFMDGVATGDTWLVMLHKPGG